MNSLTPRFSLIFFFPLYFQVPLTLEHKPAVRIQPQEPSTVYAWCSLTREYLIAVSSVSKCAKNRCELLCVALWACIVCSRVNCLQSCRFFESTAGWTEKQPNGIFSSRAVGDILMDGMSVDLCSSLTHWEVSDGHEGRMEGKKIQKGRI